jgi:hypothetical protein
MTSLLALRWNQIRVVFPAADSNAIAMDGPFRIRMG